eukprot:2245522-Prymnesium_polylepis.1
MSGELLRTRGDLRSDRALMAATGGRRAQGGRHSPTVGLPTTRGLQADQTPRGGVALLDAAGRTGRRGVFETA